MNHLKAQAGCLRARVELPPNRPECEKGGSVAIYPWQPSGSSGSVEQASALLPIGGVIFLPRKIGIAPLGEERQAG